MVERMEETNKEWNNLAKNRSMGGWMDGWLVFGKQCKPLSRLNT